MANVKDIAKKVDEKKLDTIPDLIQRSVKELGKALPSHMSAERLVRIALTTMRLNPALYDCTPESFLGALFQSAQLGLEPNVEGQAYIIPFNNKRKIGNTWTTLKEASFQIGYKGYAELFYRHEKSMSLDMQIVKQNDAFDYELGTNSYIKHKPAEGERGESTGFYAVAKLRNGGNVFKYMSKSECMEHGMKFSKCYSKRDNAFFSSTPWNTNPDAMCLKTVLVQLMKLLPKSVEVQHAIKMDETIKVKVAPDMAVIPDQTDWTDAPTVDAQKAETTPETPVKKGEGAEDLGFPGREPGEEG